MIMPNLNSLPINERIRLVQDLWDSIAADTGAIPVDPDHLVETRRRLSAYRVDGIRGQLVREAVESIRRVL
jgi:putative addiction module component (TIGR02574 family)